MRDADRGSLRAYLCSIIIPAVGVLIRLSLLLSNPDLSELPAPVAGGNMKNLVKTNPYARGAPGCRQRYPNMPQTMDREGSDLSLKVAWFQISLGVLRAQHAGPD